MDLHIGRALTPSEIAELLTEARARTWALVGTLSDEDLRRQHDPLMSPIVWDLGHIAHFEEVWLLEKLQGGDRSHEGLRGIYNPFEHPRATRDALALPSRAEVIAYLGQVRRAVLDRVVCDQGPTDDPLRRDSFVHRMVLQHECQHNETILQTLQLKQGSPYPAVAALGPPPPSTGAPAPGSAVTFDGGEVPLGTDDRSTAYDNERPRHLVRVAPFRIDVHPVTNGEYLRFMEDGGYDMPGAWSDAGWAWREEAGLRAPMYWALGAEGWAERRMDRAAPLDPLKPVIHVSHWEAEAYAAWADKRLPTEIEWEVAASWDPHIGQKRTYPWGEAPPDGTRANLDALVFDTTRVGSYPAGVSALGCWDMLGNVWEWTSTSFEAYPGFESFPYPEYSEVFFGDEHRVLRGGSWATRAGAVRNTFRNWDYPNRRQIFSGFRCASDV